ncbi:hypothetical protein GPECTOR_43g889 [Gonium pectorale]|uniref:Uncharacterized protein n=1 Tax=Gonium pectorale TaxID=33097 RepID=A0A150G9L2_GONPE|nr:hypothetical protein GPECTOR_43g889 [Gonium pectorale]|eukprot:KXZ46453.1 hypothetical protein GPECTOR_43g889 [Gonium pectorale]
MGPSAGGGRGGAQEGAAAAEEALAAAGLSAQPAGGLPQLLPLPAGMVATGPTVPATATASSNDASGGEPGGAGYGPGSGGVSAAQAAAAGAASAAAAAGVSQARIQRAGSVGFQEQLVLQQQEAGRRAQLSCAASLEGQLAALRREYEAARQRHAKEVRELLEAQRQLDARLAASSAEAQQLQAIKGALEAVHAQFAQAHTRAQAAEEEHEALVDALSETTNRADGLEMELAVAEQRNRKLSEQLRQLQQQQHGSGPAAAAAATSPSSAAQLAANGTGGSRVTAAAAPAPVLQLHLPRVDASRLRPDADHEVGFGVSELRGQMGEFRSCLRNAVNGLLALSGRALGRHQQTHQAQALVLPALCAAGATDAAATHLDRARMLETASHLMGHILLAELHATAWEDPLAPLCTPPPPPAAAPTIEAAARDPGALAAAALGRSAALADPPGADAEERALAALLRSRVARRLYDAVRCEVVRAEEEAEALAEAGGQLRAAEGAGTQTILGAAVQGISQRLAAALARATAAAAAIGPSGSEEQPQPRKPQQRPGWSATEEVPAAVSDVLRPLALRSLQLGLFVSAAHPLWRLRVAPLATGASGGAAPLACGLHVQEAAVALPAQPAPSGSPSGAVGAPSAAAAGAPSPPPQPPQPVVLCSLAPGVVCDFEGLAPSHGGGVAAANARADVTSANANATYPNRHI